MLIICSAKIINFNDYYMYVKNPHGESEGFGECSRFILTLKVTFVTAFR